MALPVGACRLCACSLMQTPSCIKKTNLSFVCTHLIILSCPYVLQSIIFHKRTSVHLYCTKKHNHSEILWWDNMFFSRKSISPNKCYPRVCKLQVKQFYIRAINNKWVWLVYWERKTQLWHMSIYILIFRNVETLLLRLMSWINNMTDLPTSTRCKFRPNCDEFI